MTTGYVKRKRREAAARRAAQPATSGYPRGAHGRPFIVDGVIYPSITAAGRELEWATPSGLAQAARLGKRYKGHDVSYAPYPAAIRPAAEAGAIPPQAAQIARECEQAQGFPLDQDEARILAGFMQDSGGDLGELLDAASRARAAALEAAKEARAARDEAEKRLTSVQWLCWALESAAARRGKEKTDA